MKAICSIALVSLCMVSMTFGQPEAEATWESDVRLLALQGDLVILPLNYTRRGFTISVSLSLDVDFLVHKCGAGSGALGIQAGTSTFLWPNIYRSDKETYSDGYDAVDYDLLLRYTVQSARYRLDGLCGVTIRHGSYSPNFKSYWTTSADVEQSSVGPKIGGAFTLMVIEPAIALRLKGSAFFFGYMPVEAGAIGLGLVVGWQRSPEDG